MHVVSVVSFVSHYMFMPPFMLIVYSNHVTLILTNSTTCVKDRKKILSHEAIVVEYGTTYVWVSVRL